MIANFIHVDEFMATHSNNMTFLAHVEYVGIFVPAPVGSLP